MKKAYIVGIVGSPRRRMNTDTLVQQVLDGCMSEGASVDKIYLNDLEIKPCQACRVQDGNGCCFHDGMDQIYEAFESADGLVLGTPVYYSSVSSQMKLMIDRSYCLARPVTLPSGERAYESCVKKRKRGIIISVGGSGLNPGCVMPELTIWSNEVNLDITDTILVSHAQLGKSPMESQELLRDAFLKGKDLVNRLGF